MKIVFVTNQKVARVVGSKSSSREIRGYGVIGTIAAPIMDSPDPGKRRRKTGTSEKLTVVSKPKLGDAEVKELNDQMCFQLNDRLEHIESIEKHFKPDGTVVVVLKRRKDELIKASSEMVERYEDQHKAPPPGGLPKKVAKYDSEILAQWYVAYVLKTGKATVAQEELVPMSQVSQPTWARYYAKSEFWDCVMKKVQIIWNIHTHASEMFERAFNNEAMESRPKQERRIPRDSDDEGEKESKTDVEHMTEWGIENTGTTSRRGRNPEERKVLDRLDVMLRLRDLGKEKLIRKILEKDSLLKKSELETLSLDELVEVAYHLVA